MSNAKHTVVRSTYRIACTSPLVAASLFAVAQTTRAATRTESFGSAPVGWQGLNNAGQGGSTFGFSNTNNTAQASGSGEAGGTFARSNIRGYYADTSIGTLTQNHFIHGEGEFYFGNGATGNTDMLIGHVNVDDIPIFEELNMDMLGIGIYEGTPEAAGFRFTALMYDDSATEIHGDRVHHANGFYKFSYDWNPIANTLTARLFDPGGAQVDQSVISAPTSNFSFNGFGLNSGLNGSPNSGQTYDVFIDAVTYTSEPDSGSIWANPSGGDWNNPANWLTTVPDAADAEAIFSGAIGTPRTVFTDTQVTAGFLTFDNAVSYQIAGNGSLVVDVTSGSAAINVVQGSHKINLPTTFNDSTNVTIPSGASLTLGDPTTLAGGITLTKNGLGTMTFLSTLSASGPATMKLNGGVTNLAVSNTSSNIAVILDPSTLNVGANTTLGAMTMNLGGNAVNVGRDTGGNNVPADLTVSSLTVTGGGSPNVLHNTLAGNAMVVSGALDVQASSVLVKQGPGVLKTNSISVNPSGQLDMTNGNAIIQTTPAATVGALIASGYASGAWNGSGINSSSAAADNTKALGFATSTESGITSLGGESASGSEVIVRYTFSGDANIDLTVDTVDFNLLAASFSQGGKLWFDGDFNYDNVVDTVDFNLLASNFSKSLPASGGDGLGALVPEPTSAAMLSLGAFALTMRRRKS